MGRGDQQDTVIPPVKESEKDSFAVVARRLQILPHDNADALEIAQIDGYQVIVRKGEYQSGDLALYIPEAAILPQQVISDLGLEGRLAGGTPDPDSPEGKNLLNRVKAIRLRGVLSQGLVYRPEKINLIEGADYTEQLGISKYRPPIPTQMSGKAEYHQHIKPYTHIENIKKFPDVLKEGEEVTFSEKLHGSLTICGVAFGERIISSKGNAKNSLVLLPERDELDRPKNVYWQAAESNELHEKLEQISAEHNSQLVHIYGEVMGVQDLMYGLNKGNHDYRAFDIRIGNDYLDYDQFLELCEKYEIPTVPHLYRGPYDAEHIEQLARGKEQYSGQELHIREGGVVKPTTERTDPQLGRVILKVISPDYLLRKGGTEYE